MMLPTFKADAIYASTGCGKTSQIGIAAERWWTKFGKRTRLITADPGGYGVLDAHVEAGIIIPWVLNLEQYPIEAMRKASQGWWPDEQGRLVITPKEAWDKIGVVAFEGMTSFGDTILK